MKRLVLLIVAVALLASTASAGHRHHRHRRGPSIIIGAPHYPYYPPGYIYPPPVYVAPYPTIPPRPAPGFFYGDDKRSIGVAPGGFYYQQR